MEVIVISHDLDTGIAELRFVHEGVTVHGTYDLGKVVPGLREMLAAQGEEFTAERQQEVIDKLTGMIQRDIDDGALKNPPLPSRPADPKGVPS